MRKSLFAAVLAVLAGVMTLAGCFFAHADNRGISLVTKNPQERKRVALVIGNGSYRHSESMPRLVNPQHDADDMASALTQFGFEVTVLKNLTKEEMEEAITAFGRRSAEGDAALFYYSGHGLQVKGQNYFVPVDANIDSEAKVSYHAVNVNLLLEEMDSARSRVNVVMLDACRNNPISGKFRSGGTKGLASPSVLPKGTVIIYATDPGNVAADGEGRNGLFTASLLSAFKGGDLTLGGVLYTASKQLQEATGQQQTPYVNGPMTLQREFSFVQPSVMTDLRPVGVKPVEPQPRQVETEPSNDAENYLMIYENRELLTVDEKHNRQKEEKVKQSEAAKTTEELARRLKSLGIEMQYVKGGCFKMGDIFNLECRGLFSEHPIHDACVDDFLIGKYEVTQGLWKKIMGSNPSKFSSCGKDCPVNNVNWEDVQKFLEKLNTATRGHFRLPTEAEWEYACRSGGRLERYCGSSDADAVAWHEGNSNEKIHKVGSKKPNALGVYDMSGNVFELVNDRSGEYTPEPQVNPVGPANGDGRIIRGGSYQVIEGGSVVGAACRVHQSEEERNPFVGFRLAASVMYKDNVKNKSPEYSREKFQEDKKNLTAEDLFDMASALINYGLIHNIDSADTTHIIQYLSEAIRISPDFADAYQERANVYKTMKEYNAAIQDYTRAMTLFKESDSKYFWAVVGRADVYSEIKDYERAINDYSTLIKLRKTVDSYEKRGKIYYEMKKYDLAAEDFTRQIDISPNETNGYINRGNARYNIGSYELAIVDYSAAIKLNPTLSVANSNRGRAYYNLGNYIEAIDDLKRSLKPNNNNVDDLVLLGLAYGKIANFAQSCNSLKAACNLGNCTEYKSLCKVTAP